MNTFMMILFLCKLCIDIGDHRGDINSIVYTERDSIMESLFLKRNQIPFQKRYKGYFKKSYPYL